MRYVDGPNLADLIAGHPLPLARVIALGEQVAQALDAVHAHGLVHLDVKPANILITTAHQAHTAGCRPGGGRSARGEHVYLADFGLTRRGATPAHTSTGAFLGSPAYAAPEHLRGQPVDTATDLYALGCVLHTALTGRAPFRGTVDDVIAGHLGADRPPASRARAAHDPYPEPGLTLGATADAVLARALAADPAERPSGADALVGELRAALVRDAQPSFPAPRPAPRRTPPPEPAPPVSPAPRQAPARRPEPSGSGSVHPDAVSRRLARPVAPVSGDPFTHGAPRARPRNLHAVIAITIGVIAVLLALGLALSLP
jgi:serine/threonine-protein kinase